MIKVSDWILPAAVIIAVYLSGFYINQLRWQSKWDQAESEAATNQLNAVNAAVEKYKSQLIKSEEINDETEQKLVESNTDSNNAANVANSLQQQFSDSMRERNECPTDTTTTRERAAIATERTVQAVVFERISRRAVEYAKIADENRIRGLACEQSYQSLEF